MEMEQAAADWDSVKEDDLMDFQFGCWTGWSGSLSLLAMTSTSPHE